MKERIKNYLRQFKPHHTIVYAFSRALLGGRKLPPGKMTAIDVEERKNRLFLLERAQQTGPIFKGTLVGEFSVCVIGIAAGRRLLRDHAAAVRPLTIPLESLFPNGFIRQMEGEVHRKYRKALVQAIQPDDFTACVKDLETITSSRLAEYAVDQNRPDCSPGTYIAALNGIASGMLLRTFFGLPPGTDSFERILKAYHKLGPHGLVWNLGTDQKEAYVEIRDHLLELYGAKPASLPGSPMPSVISRIADQMALDETMIGNLIYMVEMGRYDTYSLFRWLTKFAAQNPVMLERIAGEKAAGPTSAKAFAEAFVLESLRMVQSERLIRRIKEDFIFDGYFMPKGALLRVCLWESHKSAAAFTDPLTFNPERFLTNPPGRDEYSPFGLDQHQCPFGDGTVKMAVIYLRELARRYTVQPVADGTTVRGTYHWEPASEFGVRIQPRQG